ncbi:hypothetical protein SAMN05421833_12966 [Microbispora rosea]|uniref:Uncharacterized protein n=1 Tax=Microbispora rosea TaxID=58117 RepID=A0A1N7GIJ3_9ACTN|nr:hypothetical protein [Microbispora rosea]GIH51656.1 hypothetical protein Mro03_68350 [Microbispora rosea subsp. rosea]SIS12415.1 hypothetical protein SAMN05421833_12966 [Microbispora rosea]
MDPLVLAAATAMVTAMTTEGWQQAREAVVALWQRARPERALAIEAELEETRAEVVTARQSGDRQAEQELVGDWQRKLRRLLAADPQLGDELRRILDQELAPLLPAPEQSRIRDITMTATARGHGRVFQAGRDQHIHDK